MEIRQGALEGLEMNFWKNKRVFITGHTGFKGSWICLWLQMLGAKVTGYALEPPTRPSLFKLCQIDKLICKSVIADIRNLRRLKQAVKSARPEIIIHMAAQPIVRESYKVPVETYETNVMGTVNVLEAVRACKSVKAVVNVTTDKVYENGDLEKAFKEREALGGYDPYSSSKACSEIVSSAYRRSYSLNLATARAGNVVGGGDWAEHRLVPDFVRAILMGKKIRVRNPKATRPWQHVLEPLSGYLMLAERLYRGESRFAAAWNFGPKESDSKPVEWLVEKLCAKWGRSVGYSIDKGEHPHEAKYLRLDWTKAKKKLGWRPKWDLDYALDKIVEWTEVYARGGDLRGICWNQMEEYLGDK